MHGTHKEFLSLQPMFPHKTSDSFSPEGGFSQGLDAFRFFLNPLKCVCTVHTHAEPRWQKIYRSRCFFVCTSGGIILFLKKNLYLRTEVSLEDNCGISYLKISRTGSISYPVQYPIQTN